MTNSPEFYNREAKDSSLEAAVNTGREAEGVVDDVGQVQEDFRPLGERVVEGIEQVMRDQGLRSHDVNKEMYGFFLKELQKRGKVAERDMRFTPENVIAEELDKIARKKVA